MFNYLVFYFYEKDEFTDGHGFVEMSLSRAIKSAEDIKKVQAIIKAKLNYMTVSITGYNEISKNEQITGR